MAADAAPAALKRRSAARLHDAKVSEGINGAHALADCLGDALLATHLVEGQPHHVVFSGLRDYQNALLVAEKKCTRVDPHAADLDWRAIVDDLATWALVL